METPSPKVPAKDTAKALQYPEDTGVPQGLHLQMNRVRASTSAKQVQSLYVDLGHSICEYHIDILKSGLPQENCPRRHAETSASPLTPTNFPHPNFVILPSMKLYLKNRCLAYIEPLWFLVIAFYGLFNRLYHKIINPS